MGICFPDSLPNGPTAVIAPMEFAYRDLWNVGRGSLRLEARELHHLTPLFGFFGDELSEVVRRACKYRCTQVSESCLHLGMGKTRIYLLVETVNDFGWRVLRGANSIPAA